jgi:hypothetical protein
MGSSYIDAGLELHHILAAETSPSCTPSPIATEVQGESNGTMGHPFVDVSIELHRIPTSEVTPPRTPSPQVKKAKLQVRTDVWEARSGFLYAVGKTPATPFEDMSQLTKLATAEQVFSPTSTFASSKIRKLMGTLSLSPENTLGSSPSTAASSFSSRRNDDSRKSSIRLPDFKDSFEDDKTK